MHIKAWDGDRRSFGRLCKIQDDSFWFQMHPFHVVLGSERNLDIVDRNNFFPQRNVIIGERMSRCGVQVTVKVNDQSFVRFALLPHDSGMHTHRCFDRDGLRN